MIKNDLHIKCFEFFNIKNYLIEDYQKIIEIQVCRQIIK